MVENNSGEILIFENISKRFGGVRALQDVSFSVRRGEVHALVGENGAGKSTLINLCGGVYPSDGGRIVYSGRELADIDPKKCRSLGINIVHQELSLCPDLTVSQNIFLGPNPPSRGTVVNRKKMLEVTQDLFKQLGVTTDPGELAGNLRIGQQQQVEIAKAIYGQPQLIVMDEPTSALTTSETKALFEIIARLKAKSITIIYVSHKIEEVFAIADRITVLRDGKYIATKDVRDTSPAEVIALMVGKLETDLYPKRKPTIGQVVLKAEKVSSRNRNELSDVSFELAAGEIVGVAGLAGSGNSTLLRTIFGIGKRESGAVYVDGKESRGTTPETAIKSGIGYIPASRQEEGLALTRSIKDNLAYLNLDRVSKYQVVSRREVNSLAHQYLKELNIRAHGIDESIDGLSGGNQQKVVIAKWLATQPRVLLMDDPTRGVDVGSKAEIHMLFCRLADKGIGIMFTSSELPELVAMSDRIIIMYKGKLVKELKREEASQEVVMQWATGFTSTRAE
jgi:ribose transport system ATP-binding protein